MNPITIQGDDGRAIEVGTGGVGQIVVRVKEEDGGGLVCALWIGEAERLRNAIQAAMTIAKETAR